MTDISKEAVEQHIIRCWMTDPDPDRTQILLRALSARIEQLEARQYALAYAIAGGEDAHGLLDSVATEDLVKMIRDERAQQAAWNDATAKLAREAARREAADHSCAVLDAFSEYDQNECCDGRECGCQGSSVHDHIKHMIRSDLINKEPKP